MYFLMNKDNIIACLHKKNQASFAEDVSFEVTETIGALPFGFKNINSWIDSRKSSKHNRHLQRIMHQMNCDDNEGFIHVTHAATINDTFWIKADSENVTWDKISLYRNRFTETISRLAFEGVGLYATEFSSTSPELTCEGSFRKCFRKEKNAGEFGSDIFIYKRGGEYGAGLEPYCEMLASEIAGIISPYNSVKYDIVTLHDKIASRCNLFTNEEYGYASFAKVAKVDTLQEVFEYFEKIGAEQQFREMLVVDSLCFNQDRHKGNYGILFNNETMQILGMAPIFDMNLSMLPYVSMNDFANIGDRLFEYAPKLGNDFTRLGQMAMNETLRNRVKEICDFSFSFRGDDIFTHERVSALENVIHTQAKALLSQESLLTKDVFFSKDAVLCEQRKQEINKAERKLREFVEEINDHILGEDVFTSECVSSDTVQLYFEMHFYEITVDFLKRKISIADDCLNPITSEILKSSDSNVWELYILLDKTLSEQE